MKVSVNHEEHKCTSSSKDTKRMGLAFWMAAWDRYTLAAVCLGQLDFTSCTLYKTKIVDLAAEAMADSRGPLVAVLYDELLRHYVTVSPPLPR